jgi:hypothetical protein
MEFLSCNSAAQTSLWRDIREPANQKLLQQARFNAPLSLSRRSPSATKLIKSFLRQVLKDAISTCDGVGPEYSKMRVRRAGCSRSRSQVGSARA